MKKRSRRARAPKEPGKNGTDPGPIERAIDAAAARTEPADLTVKLHRAPVRMKANSRITITQGSNPNIAEIMVRDPDGVWHGVLLPPGARFELRHASPAPDLWTPPGSRR